MVNWHRLANPTSFLKWSRRVLPWASVTTVILLAAGLYLSLFVAPPDYQQGETVRIMFVHVPSAWMALFTYAVMAGASATGLIWKSPLSHLTAKAAAPIGASFTLLALVTGALWGQPMWGTWWVWDARLTSVLILFFLYLGYIALWEAIDDYTRAAKSTAILALVGVVNIPIIKFSVDWWNTLHQPASVLRMDGPSIHPSLLVPLLVMGGAFTGYFIVVLLIRLEREILARQAQVLRRAQLRS
ncbi:MAG: heme ABC transporter permease [Alphaproteobacteria bacterium]|nr:heme ABC transporter permease [Alphaproteobacteria bacterium]MCY4498926.1 heme ABC transporter permease [Rhodospirillaceae bacterium]